MSKTTRKVVRIDEERCDGCGLCVPSCAEGAIQVIDGKARLVSEVYCDGLGACLGECPRGAITVEERPADAFDEKAVEKHLAAAGREETPRRREAAAGHAFGCPGSRMMDLRGAVAEGCAEPEVAFGPRAASELRQWPVKLYLVSPNAPYFQGAELLLAADCAPVACASFHADFLRGKAVVIGCPKFDDVEAYRRKLAAILRANDVKKVTVLHMEVPCCFGLVRLAQEAVRASGKDVPLEDATVGIRGEVTVVAGV